MMRATLWASLACLAWACTGPTEGESPAIVDDAKPPDALTDGSVDRGRVDAVVDQAVDRGVPVDAALVDRGLPIDRGMPVDAASDPDGALSDMGMRADAIAPDAGPPPCDPQRVLINNGCTAGAGCHEPAIDWTPEGLVNVEARSGGCENRVLIDPNDVQRSLLLQSIGAAPPPAGAIDSCDIQMPLGADPGADPIGEDDRACLQAWVEEIAADNQEEQVEYQPTTVESALRKVKMLLTGQAPTADEVARVQADRAALGGLVDQWTQTPEFETKLSDFLVVALQQRVQSPLRTFTADQFDDFRQSGRRAILLKTIFEESFVRTAVDIVQRGLSFDQVVQTNQWMVTTANLVLLRYLEQTFAQRERLHTLYRRGDDDERPLDTQIRQRRWAVTGLESDTCTVPQTHMLSVLFGFVETRRHCEPQPESNLLFNDGVLTDEDFTDWRLVRFVRPEQAEPGEREILFYDVPALRDANQVVTRLPRIGFFTTPTFLGNWATNPDNQFRVTTNQTLLGALHTSFSAAEPTEPLSDGGLDGEHAVPGTACYGCHRQLDPMRVYFGRVFNTRYQRPRGDGENSLIFDPSIERPIDPSFAFRGVVDNEGRSLEAFALTLVEHPRFPVAWVQKLCLYANSARCNASDPAFVEIAGAFSRERDFRALIVDLFSSPLVTGLTQTLSWHPDGPPISITRRGHLCTLLSVRTGFADVCNLNHVKQVIGLIPQDDFSRGAVDPSQPARPSAFHFAAAQSVCDGVARRVVNQNGIFSTNDVEGTLDRMVTRLMALPEGHPRHASARAVLGAHYQALRDAEVESFRALRSAFSLACLSPDVMGVGL